MSHYTLYEAAITMSKNALTSLEDVIKKAQASPVAAAIPTAKIHESMLPFTFQVYVVTNFAQKMLSRLAGKEVSDLDNNLTTYEEMLARIAEVQKVLDAAPDKDTINARSSENVQLGLGPGKEVTLLAWQYVHGYILPNIFFHLTTAYDIARKEGVELGKSDYITPFMSNFVSS